MTAKRKKNKLNIYAKFETFIFFFGNVSSSFTPITHLKNARERVESLFICLLYECFKSLGSHFTSNGTHGQYFR